MFSCITSARGRSVALTCVAISRALPSRTFEP
jgi:hypothetical protein